MLNWTLESFFRLLIDTSSANEHYDCPKMNTSLPLVVPLQSVDTVFAFLLPTILKTEREKEYFTCSLFFDAVGNYGTE